MAAALEQHSEHPLAKAILLKANEDHMTLQEVSDFQALPGNGLTARLNGTVLNGGNADFISTKVSVSSDMQAAATRLAEQGKTPLFFVCGEKLAGFIAAADSSKRTARKPSARCRTWASV